MVVGLSTHVRSVWRWFRSAEAQQLEDAYGRGYAAGREKAYRDIDARLNASSHPSPCGCDSCITIKKIRAQYDPAVHCRPPVVGFAQLVEVRMRQEDRTASWGHLGLKGLSGAIGDAWGALTAAVFLADSPDRCRHHIDQVIQRAVDVGCLAMQTVEELRREVAGSQSKPED